MRWALHVSAPLSPIYSWSRPHLRDLVVPRWRRTWDPPSSLCMQVSGCEKHTLSCCSDLWLCVHWLRVSQPVYMPSARGVTTLLIWLTAGVLCWYQRPNHSHLPCFDLSQIGYGVQSLTFQWNCLRFGCAACQCRCSFGHWGCRLLASALMWWSLGAS